MVMHRYRVVGGRVICHGPDCLAACVALDVSDSDFTVGEITSALLSHEVRSAKVTTHEHRSDDIDGRLSYDLDITVLSPAPPRPLFAWGNVAVLLLGLVAGFVGNWLGWWGS